MFPGVENVRVFVRPGATDMRKAINGLSAMAQEAMGQNPLDGALFVFCNARRTLLKILYWDHNGFCLWMKKLEKHRFPWPRREAECVAIDEEQLHQLLRGVDFWNAHETLFFSRVI
jgi:transposase